MTYNNTRSWVYSPDFEQEQNLIDPRIMIAKQIAWYRGKGPETDRSVPEPDNFNRAIINDKPKDCEFIEDQVFYYDLNKDKWFSLYYVEDDQIQEFETWIEQIKPKAYWRHLSTPKIRPQKTLLWCRENKSKNTLTDNERLHTLGYYENLKVKYFNDDTTYVDSLLGQSRDLSKILVPEEQEDIDDCDNSSVLFNS